MSFKTYNNSLIRVAEINYQKTRPNQALQYLIKENLLTLNEKIFESIVITILIDFRNSMIICNSSTISMKGNDYKEKIMNSNLKIDFTFFINTCGIIFPIKELKEAITYIIINHVLPVAKNLINRNPSLHINFLMEKSQSLNQ